MGRLFALVAPGLALAALAFGAVVTAAQQVPASLTLIAGQGPWEGQSHISSGIIGKDQTFSVTFAQPGQYNYRCLLHVNMTGAVDVVEPAPRALPRSRRSDRLDATHMQAVHDAQVTHLLATRQAPRPMPSAAHDPAAFFNSGLMGYNRNQTIGGAATWALTFDTPGTYEYFCYIRGEIDMRGTVTVE